MPRRTKKELEDWDEKSEQEYQMEHSFLDAEFEREFPNATEEERLAFENSKREIFYREMKYKNAPTLRKLLDEQTRLENKLQDVREKIRKHHAFLNKTDAKGAVED